MGPRKISVAAIAAVTMAGTAAAAQAAPSEGEAPAADTTGTGWHEVEESWRSVSYDGLFLPADRYCDGFDLQTSTVHQDVRARVTTRWDGGAARTTSYRGPLLSEATNLSTGASTQLSMSGRAEVLTRPDGSIAVYTSTGPIGMGWPQDGGGLERGFHVLKGHHVTTFATDGSREIEVDRGSSVNVCELVD